jgi:hypothetical protein
MKTTQRCDWRKYLPTNSGPAAWACAALPPSLPAALSPLPFPFDHPPQSLAAERAAKPLARAATDEYKPRVAPWTLATKKCAKTPWALTLASLRGACAGGLWGRGHRRLGLACVPTFRAPASIPLALSLPFFPPHRGLPILPAGTSAPPSPSCGPAIGTAITGLGVGGTKEPLASLEQTPSLPRPTSPLTGDRFVTSSSWAQGSG